MNRSRPLIVLAALLFVAAAAWGQRREACCPKYDVDHERMIHAVVEKVQVRYGQTEQAGVHLLARAKDGLYDIHVGPRSYLKKLGVTFEQGDAMVVVGAPVVGQERVDSETPLAFVPRTIQRGDDSIELRTEDGFPLWRNRPT